MHGVVPRMSPAHASSVMIFFPLINRETFRGRRIPPPQRDHCTFSWAIPRGKQCKLRQKQGPRSNTEYRFGNRGKVNANKNDKKQGNKRRVKKAEKKTTGQLWLPDWKKKMDFYKKYGDDGRHKAKHRFRCTISSTLYAILYTAYRHHSIYWQARTQSRILALKAGLDEKITSTMPGKMVFFYEHNWPKRA